MPHGLHAEYFDNGRWSGQPRVRTVDPSASTDRVTANWVGDPPQSFSVRWYGYISLPRPALYTFAIRSDDGATLRIDGEMVVDNGGRHAPITRTGAAELDAGSHFVLLEFAQEVGDYEIAWLQAGEDGGLAPVPAWTLSTRRVDRWKLIVAWGLRWVLTILGGLAVAAASIVLLSHRQQIAVGVRRHPRAATSAMFAALAVAHTWPLAAHPARLSRNNNGDTIANEWTLAWVAHQAPRAPLRLYDANIYHPDRGTLAYAESLIVQSAMAAPLLWLGASPVLAYNVVLIAGFALTGWAMCLMIGRWTGDWTAAIAAGMIAGFNAHTLARLPHLQVQHGEFFFGALIALDALLRDPRTKYAMQLAAWFTLHALTSLYFLVFAAMALTAAAAVRPAAWVGPRARKVLPRIALAAALSAVALTPFLLPYWTMFDEQGMYRPLADAGGSAATWRHYLSTPGRFHHGLWGYRVFAGLSLFPGVTALALTAVAVGRGVAFRDPRARMCLAFGVAGVLLSLGTTLPFYAVLYEFVLPLRVIREVARFGYLGIIAAAALAGFGLADARRRIAGRGRIALSGTVLALITLETFVAPISYVRFEGIPPIYDRLRDAPGAVAVEMPFHRPNDAFLHAPYMLNSTRHWRPILNGYSGFQPESFRRHAARLGSFPSEGAIAALAEAGATHVFVHLDQYGDAAIDQMNGVPALQRLAVEDGIALYRLTSSRMSTVSP